MDSKIDTFGRIWRIWRIYLFNFFLGKNASFFSFFFNVFSYWGERFYYFFQYQQAKNRARRSKMDPKIDTFGQVDIRVLAILGVKKVVLWTFSKLFWGSLRSVWALFLDLEGPLLGVFLARKVEI